LLAVFKGPTSKRRDWKTEGREREGDGKRRGRKRRGRRKREGPAASPQYFGLEPPLIPR